MKKTIYFTVYIVIILTLACVVLGFPTGDAGAAPNNLFYNYRLTADVPFTTLVNGHPSTTASGILNSGIQMRIIRTEGQYTRIQIFTTWIVWVPTDQLQYELTKTRP